ncbi:MAG TPA: hypothetical protein DCX07_04320 [Phycisphaerales bacterium]|nr:hypothetical protein [Phycisphaerales bacterium]
MKEYQILCVDDDEEFLASLESSLPSKVAPLCDRFGCVFEFVSTPGELLEILSSSDDDSVQTAMVISDQVMPGITGIELIEKIKADRPDVMCVLLTGHAGMESAKYAINHHLLDQYVGKPIEDLHEFASLVANLLKAFHLDLEERARTAELARTVEELRIANENIRAMQTAAEQVAMLSKNLKSLDFNEVMELVTSDVPKLFDAKWSVLCFPDNDCPVVAKQRNHCPCPEEQLAERIDNAENLQRGEVVMGEVPIFCAELEAESPDLIIPLRATSSSQARSDAEQQGFLCMCHLGEHTSGTDRLIRYKAELVREILGANLTNARLYQEARLQSRVDSLTGVNTRRVLEERLESEHDRSDRYGGTFCLTILDVDGFKSINDTFGHEAGDNILKALAAVLHGEARSTDLIARYGGDEFVILMPETALEDARKGAERIRALAQEILTPSGHALTISCGVAQWSGSAAEAASEVLRRADAALYVAKRGGRNQVQVGDGIDAG